MTASTQLATAGAPLSRAKAAMVLLHGRGASAASILGLAELLGLPDVAYVAPQAPGGTWYPYSFLAPIAENEPHLSRSLATVARVVEDLSVAGFDPERLGLLGFSQGGCLGLEFAARNVRRYGAVIGLSAGLIGPAGTPRAYAGSLAGTRIFLGCSEVDAHIPLWRVQETSRVMRALGGSVVERIYPGMGHAINDDEIGQVRAAAASLLQPVPTNSSKETPASQAGSQPISA